MRILLVEDDPALGEAVRDHLRSLAHAVDREERLASAEAALRAVPYDLVLLDLGLPDGDGLAFLKRLRARGDTTPVIVLTARDRIGERIAGLEAGADDYLVKPFDLGELAARVAAVARRYAGDPNPLLEIGPLLVDGAGGSSPVRVRRSRFRRANGRCSRPWRSAPGRSCPRSGSRSSSTRWARRSRATRSRSR